MTAYTAYLNSEDLGKALAISSFSAEAERSTLDVATRSIDAISSPLYISFISPRISPGSTGATMLLLTITFLSTSSVEMPFGHS